MGKLRVHELARKLNISNQEVIARLNAKGVMVRTHSSNVDEALAMKALGAAPGHVAAKAERPRTVLRRRKDQPEELLTPEPHEEDAFRGGAETRPIAQEDHGTIVASENEIEDKTSGAAENKEEVIKVSKPERSHAVVQQEAKVPLAEKKPDGGVLPQLKEEKMPFTQGSAEVSPSNVVRVIDAEAIKARLASEGRSFHRRGGPMRPGGGPQGHGPSASARPGQAARPYGGEREGQTAAPVADASGGPSDAGQRPGGRPSK